MKKWTCILGAFLLTGCASLTQSSYAIRIPNLDKPLIQIQRISASQLPIGLRTTSENQREFYSRFFVLVGQNFRDAGDAADRYYTKITVLGDQRPYNVDLEVVHERRLLVDGHYTYVKVGHDMRLAKILAAKLKHELTKRREQLNIIDDFRVF